MADNVVADPGSGGSTFAADDIGGVLYPRTKLIHGVDGVNDGDVSTANPLPVTVTSLAVTGGGVEATALRVTVASDSTGVLSIDDNGGSITVDGTVAVSSNALPTGASTLAEQQTQTASLSVMDDWDESDRAKVNPIAGQVGVAGGTGVDGATVQRVSLATNVALPAGTNAIGKLAANSGVDIGDVDVTSLPALPAGSNVIGHVIVDTTSTTAVTQATGTNLHMVVDSGTITTVSAVTAISNALPAGNNNIGDVDVVTLPNVTLAAGTNTNEVVGDAAHDAVAAGNPVLIGGYAKAAAPTDVSGDADAVNAWFLRNGAQATVITAAGALVGGDASNGLDVDVTRLPALVAGAAIVGKVGIDQTTPGTTNAVAATNLPTTVDTNSGNKSASTLRVVLATDQPALTNKLLVTPDANSAINVAQVGGTNTVSGGVSGSMSVGGPTAADGVLAANPVTIGGLARTAPPTAVAQGDVVNTQHNIYGEAIVRHSLRETKGNQQTSISNSTSETTIVTADATYKLDLYGLILTNLSGTATKVTIKDSTAGTTRAILQVPPLETRGFMLSACDGHKQTTANNNWTATCGTAVTTLEVTALFVQNL